MYTGLKTFVNNTRMVKNLCEQYTQCYLCEQYMQG